MSTGGLPAPSGCSAHHLHALVLARAAAGAALGCHAAAVLFPPDLLPPALTRSLCPAGAEGVVFEPGADVSWIKKTKVVSLEIHVSGGRAERWAGG